MPGDIGLVQGGDAVWIKNSKVTGITSPQSVVVNGMPQHIGDVHQWFSSLLPVHDGDDTSSGSNEWREPSFSASSNDIPSESKKNARLIFVDPSHLVNIDSDPSTSDNLA